MYQAKKKPTLDWFKLVFQPCKAGLLLIYLKSQPDQLENVQNPFKTIQTILNMQVVDQLNQQTILG